MSSRMSRFNEIRSKCLTTGILYEDPEFPAVPKSVYFSKVDPTIQWRRPCELTRQAMFIDNSGASRFDLDQGALGDCWFVAAAATLACHPDLFKVVVPDDQSYDRNSYAGVFHFNFWCFGKWCEVIIDDRLPTVQGRHLAFCSNRERANEFWPGLLEKAYAKLCGSYEAMDGGWTEDALVDFTGGIGQRIDLTRKKEIPPNFFDRLLVQHQMSTLMGCSINATKDTMEDQLSNGLIIGHAYSVTKVLQIQSAKGSSIQLLRLRNPWGRKEWNGAWSDRSREWLGMDSKVRQELGVITEEDGEFWMSFSDWLDNFHALQMCHLPPNSSLAGRQKWKEMQFNGSWIRGVNAGGSKYSRNSDQFWNNIAQYSVTLTAAHSTTPSTLSSRMGQRNTQQSRGVATTNTSSAVGADLSPCSMIVSLLQKDTRKKRTEKRQQFTEVAMAFDLFKMKTSTDMPQVLTATQVDKNAQFIARFGSEHEYFREVAHSFHVEPGVYVVVPSTYDSNAQTDYLLRVYTDSWADGSEMDVTTEPIRSAPANTAESLQQLFVRYAGSDGVIDFRELQLILNQAFTQELGRDHSFDQETCRSLLSMLDKNQSGALEFKEFQMLWAELLTWKATFHQFDKDASGYIDIDEIKNIFRSIGYNLSRAALSAVVRRYGGKEGRLAFNDFVIAITKVVTVIDRFTKYSSEGLKGKAQLTLDELLQTVMFF